VLGDKVVVFTKSPGTVKKEITVNQRRPRLPEDESLQPYYRQVIDAMRGEIAGKVDDGVI
jgi:ABC-type nitrate/sulfonate/bicarbonate transport system ATPase subunit